MFHEFDWTTAFSIIYLNSEEWFSHKVILNLLSICAKMAVASAPTKYSRAINFAFHLWCFSFRVAMWFDLAKNSIRNRSELEQHANHDGADQFTTIPIRFPRNYANKLHANLINQGVAWLELHIFYYHYKVVNFLILSLN